MFRVWGVGIAVQASGFQCARGRVEQAKPGWLYTKVYEDQAGEHSN